MLFAHLKTAARFTGKLADDPEVDYHRTVLALVPLDGGSTIYLEPCHSANFVLIEATLNELSMLDGAGFTFSRHSCYGRPHTRRREPE